MIIWIKSQKLAVRLYPEAGSSLTAEDVDNGFVDSVIYDSYDLDGSMVGPDDGGILMSKRKLNAKSALRKVYTNIVSGPYNKDDIIVLEGSYGD